MMPKSKTIWVENNPFHCFIFFFCFVLFTLPFTADWIVLRRRIVFSCSTIYLVKVAQSYAPFINHRRPFTKSSIRFTFWLKVNACIVGRLAIHSPILLIMACNVPCTIVWPISVSLNFLKTQISIIHLSIPQFYQMTFSSFFCFFSCALTRSLQWLKWPMVIMVNLCHNWR